MVSMFYDFKSNADGTDSLAMAVLVLVSSCMAHGVQFDEVQSFNVAPFHHGILCKQGMSIRQ